MVVFLLATIAALIGGVVFFGHFHNRPPVAVRARAEVEKAYLDWGRNGLANGFRIHSLSI
jgi:hypothetical protein